MNCGWKGKIQEFLQIQYPELEQALMAFVYDPFNAEYSAEELEKIQSQKHAWKDSFLKLKKTLQDFEGVEGSIIFEYAIIRGSGRRPDVILLLPGQVLVIECKSYNEVNVAEYVQTSLYVRDIQEYHSTVQDLDLKVRGILFLTNDHSESFIPLHEYQIYKASENSLSKLISAFLKNERGKRVTAGEFLKGTYQPSPSMLEAAHSIFNNEELPRIKAIDSSNFDDVYETVQEVIKEAQTTNTNHLILVSGEPGAGKTFLGLQIAHKTPDSVYLSGNGPLVEVLQDTLDNKTFVQSLYGYKQDFLRYGRTPNEKIIIFDEAQRAWDAKKMDGPLSEPDVIVQIAKKDKPWSVVIGLIGNGQEIHLGEEGGLELWNVAIKNQGITVHAKNHNTKFNNAKNYQQHEHLHLNSSLRSHTALKYHSFVNSLLDGDIENSIDLMKPLQKQRYPIFLTDDLVKARTYLSNMYVDDTKIYGLICASGADYLKDVPVIPFGGRNILPKPATAYFNYPDSEYYCKKANYAATEFQIQGLELDTVIVHWSEDLLWKKDKWHCRYTKQRAINPEQMKINAYRVLLTRGRDATIIYIPKTQALKSTWDLFSNSLMIPIL